MAMAFRLKTFCLKFIRRLSLRLLFERLDKLLLRVAFFELLFLNQPKFLIRQARLKLVLKQAFEDFVRDLQPFLLSDDTDCGLRKGLVENARQKEEVVARAVLRLRVSPRLRFLVIDFLRRDR